MTLYITPMLMSHLDQVLAIENQSFPTPWSRGAFVGELSQNPLALYLVGIVEGRVVCYAGTWLIHGEAHITNVAVDPAFRGKNYGEKICTALIEAAAAAGARRATLEVRMSNSAAQSLYIKMGFRSVGLRPGYYTDTDEDAIIMWKEGIESKKELKA